MEKEVGAGDGIAAKHRNAHRAYIVPYIWEGLKKHRVACSDMQNPVF
jgi:hypothetical protein